MFRLSCVTVRASRVWSPTTVYYAFNARYVRFAGVCMPTIIQDKAIKMRDVYRGTRSLQKCVCLAEWLNVELLMG